MLYHSSAFWDILLSALAFQPLIVGFEGLYL